MKRPRRVGAMLTGLSALLAVATAGLWLRSEFAADFPIHLGRSSQLMVAWSAGELAVISFRPDGAAASIPDIRFQSGGPPVLICQSLTARPGTRPPEFWQRMGFNAASGARVAGWAGGFSIVTVPFWFLLFLFSPPLLVATTKWLRRWRWARLGRCISCGYDLRGSKRRCPECGSQFGGRLATRLIPMRTRPACGQVVRRASA